jgi:hypothetical protein
MTSLLKSPLKWLLQSNNKLHLSFS